MIDLFTHTDLDGVGCSAVASICYEVLGCRAGDGVDDARVNITYCSYNDVNTKVFEYLMKLSNGQLEYPDMLLITDISVSDDVARLIESMRTQDQTPSLKDRVLLLDHHKTAEHLNKYEWCHVMTDIPQKDGVIHKTCGTELLYNYVIDEGISKGNRVLDDFVECVRLYDTWEWDKLKEEDDIKTRVLRLHTLFTIYGLQEFPNIITDMVVASQASTITFSKSDDALITAKLREIEKYKKAVADSIIDMEIDKYSCGIVVADQYTSEVGNYIAKTNPHLDIVILINMRYKTISYRTVKKDVDVSNFAASFGGGGHKEAAGSPIINDMLYDMIAVLFNRKHGGNEASRLLGAKGRRNPK